MYVRRKTCETQKMADQKELNKNNNNNSSTWAILVFCVNLSYGDLCTILHPQQQQQMADACKD